MVLRSGQRPPLVFLHIWDLLYLIRHHCQPLDTPRLRGSRAFAQAPEAGGKAGFQPKLPGGLGSVPTVGDRGQGHRGARSNWSKASLIMGRGPVWSMTGVAREVDLQG